MRYALLIIVPLTLTGCFANVVDDLHDRYCNRYDEDQRAAFRAAADGKVTVNCPVDDEADS